MVKHNLKICRQLRPGLSKDKGLTWGPKLGTNLNKRKISILAINFGRIFEKNLEFMLFLFF